MTAVLLGAVLAGALTTLAPCVLPLLPVIVGGSIASDATARADRSAQLRGAAGGVATATAAPSWLSRHRGAVVITAALGLSVLVFTLLLKASTVLLGIPQEVWQWVSGVLLVGLGLMALFPDLWERAVAASSLQSRTAGALQAARQREGTLGLILTGAALGPVFTSCSPLYGYVIVTVLPADPVTGLAVLLAYIAGLCVTLLAIALAGQRLVRGARWAADPHGWFRRGLGAVFVLIGVLVLTRWMKDIETWLIGNSPIRPWDLDRGFIPE